jgi:hypothetical protein
LFTTGVETNEEEGELGVSVKQSGGGMLSLEEPQDPGTDPETDPGTGCPREQEED